MATTIITGPGKSGGSLLMCILTELGVDTGFSKRKTRIYDDDIDEFGDVGGEYEWPTRGRRKVDPIPSVIKEPQICADIDLRIEALNLDVDHVYILLRRPGPIATALEFIRRGSKKKSDRGILGKDLEKIEGFLTRRIIQVVHLVAEMDLPVTLLSYPKFASDHEYAYKKLSFLLEKNNISFEEYKKVADRCIDKKLVQRAYDDMPEWCRAMMREAFHSRKRL